MVGEEWHVVFVDLYGGILQGFGPYRTLHEAQTNGDWLAFVGDRFIVARVIHGVLVDLLGSDGFALNWMSPDTVADIASEFSWEISPLLVGLS